MKDSDISRSVRKEKPHFETETSFGSPYLILGFCFLGFVLLGTGMDRQEDVPPSAGVLNPIPLGANGKFCPQMLDREDLNHVIKNQKSHELEGINETLSSNPVIELQTIGNQQLTNQKKPS